MLIHQSRTPTTIFLHPNSYVLVHICVADHCFHVGMAFSGAILSWRPLQTVDGCSWILLVSASPLLNIPNDILWCQMEVSMMPLIWCIKFVVHPWVYSPQHCLVLRASSKELENNILKPRSALKSVAGIVSCCFAQSCHGVGPITVFRNLTLVAEFDCSLPSLYLIHIKLKIIRTWIKNFDHSNFCTAHKQI